MAQISRKKSIIKKREQTFHARTEKGITKKKVFGWLASGAAYIEKKRKDPATRKAVGSFFETLAEGGRRFGEAHSVEYRKRKTTKKHKKGRR